MATTMAINEAENFVITEAMRKDPSVFIYGQGYPQGGRDLYEEFGQLRVNFAPISETAMTGVAVGAAVTGTRPICVHALSDFIMTGAEQFINEAARIRFKLGHKIECPAIYKIGYGLTIGASVQHSNCYYNKFADTPGLVVAIPSMPGDVVGLWRTAFQAKDPVQIWTSLMIGGVKGPVPDGEYTIPFGQGDVKQEGSDLTIAAIGYMVHFALQAAEELAAEGISAEVWDPRTLRPFDRSGLMNSVQKTGALLVADEEPKTFGTTGEFAMSIAETMDPVPPMGRVTLMDASKAFSPRLESYVMPTKDKIVEGAKALLERKSGGSSPGVQK